MTWGEVERLRAAVTVPEDALGRKWAESHPYQEEQMRGLQTREMYCGEHTEERHAGQGKKERGRSDDEDNVVLMSARLKFLEFSSFSIHSIQRGIIVATAIIVVAYYT